MNHRIVTLDAAGTLINPAEPVAVTYERLSRAHGASLNVEALGPAFRTSFSKMPPMAFALADPDTLDRLERGWWRRLVREVTDAAGGVAAFDGFFDDLYEYYRRGEAWSVYPEVPSVLHGLSARGCRLAVISNFDSRLVDVLEDLDLTRWFEVITYSTGAKSAKPDTRIFLDTLDALGAAADDAIHAGDNPAADYSGALEAGLAGLLLRRGESSSPLESHEARDLTALLDLV